MDCPFRYFLQYHLQLPELRKNTIATHKGSAVHEALELYVGGHDYHKILKDYYAKYKVWEFDDRKPKRGFPHPVEKSCDTCQWAVHDKIGRTATICSIAQRDMHSFDGCPKPNFEDDLRLTKEVINNKDSVLNRKIIGAEVPFEMEFEGFKVRGFMDLVTEVNEDTLEVIDYKTGNYAKTGDDAFKDLQMRIYSMVAKILFPQYKYVLMTLYYVRKKPVTVIFGADDDEKTEAFLRDSYQKIVSSVNPPRQKSFKCSWCIGYDKCEKVRDEYIEDGTFKMPEPSKLADYQKPKTIVKGENAESDGPPAST